MTREPTTDRRETTRRTYCPVTAQKRAECREYGHDWRGYEGERSEHGHVCNHCGAVR